MILQYISLAFICFLIGSKNDPETLDEVIVRHKKAIEFNELLKIQDLEKVGTRETCLSKYDTCYNDFYRELVKKPSLYIYESETFGYKIYQGFDGVNVWSTISTGSSDANLYSLQNFKATIVGVPYLYEQGWIKSFEIQKRKKQIELKVVTDQGQSFHVYLDKKKYLIKSLRFETVTNNKLDVIEFFISDYRNVNNCVIPFNEICVINGEKFTEIQIEEVIPNNGIKEEVFLKSNYLN